MLPAKVDEALRMLAQALAGDATLRPRLCAAWQSSGRQYARSMASDVPEAAETLAKTLPALTRSANVVDRLGGVLADRRGEVLFAWCEASVARNDVRIAELLGAAAAAPALAARVVDVARKRLVQGPLEDALGCVPLLGDGEGLLLPVNDQARSRLEILLWEAGASALEVPEVGKWLWAAERTFDVMVAQPARGSLRGRVLAARCLETCVRGMPRATTPEFLGRTLQVLQPLLLHPEPLVSTHAARALGLLAGAVEHLEGMLLDWMAGESLVLRERAMTAFASLPADRLRVLGHELTAVLDREEDQSWAACAAARGTPYLFRQRRELWDDLAGRIMQGVGGSAAARELAHGLSALWRGGAEQRSITEPMRELRELARRTCPDSIDAAGDWLAVLSATDPIDGAERGPLDIERGLENLVHLAAQYDDEEADARAARFAAGVHRTFEEACSIALGEGSVRHRAAAMNALEGCARAMALRLWGPQLATHPRGDAVLEPDLSEAWKAIAGAPTELLDVVRERRASSPAETGETPGQASDELALEVLAVRLGGYALDACGNESELGPGRGPTAHATCRWLRKMDGVADGSRELPLPLKHALSSIFWRLVDTTRGTALGAVDDVEWLGPFAAWWALVIDRPVMLEQLATALPMIQGGALERCCELAETIRAEVSSGAPDGQWGPVVDRAFEKLHASETELAEALSELGACLAGFCETSGRSPDLEPKCVELVLAAERLQAALADPVKGLHAAFVYGEDSLSRATSENVPRIASLLTRAIRARELSMLDVWFTSLGPVTSALVETAVRGAVGRTPPPPPSSRKLEPETVEGYELVRPLGEGGVGKVWLVRKPGADRLFVLKIPKVEALTGASDTERQGLLESFIEEANALAGLYHPNVANIIDRGVSKDVPFLVLELLIGADLKQYAGAQRLTLFEARQAVLDACAGLAALHGAGLVHRDIKPANIWLRLPLDSGERFDPRKHRDPARTRPLSAVVIDFGMVRPMRVTAEAGGRFVAGTPGYIAPEQVLDPLELDGRADVYALAATLYNVTTGRAFFDDVKNPRDRIFAHMQRDPFEDPSRLAGFPTELVKLMRAATALDPKDRPHPMEFGRAFEATI